jgi:hypothetical protein
VNDLSHPPYDTEICPSILTELPERKVNAMSPRGHGDCEIARVPWSDGGKKINNIDVTPQY